jgi:hypothetical protein
MVRSSGERVGGVFEAPILSLDDRRARVRALDACLACLENAQERGETEVSDDLAAQLRASVPGVAAGMSTTHALDLVFAAQSHYLTARVGARGRRSVDGRLPSWGQPVDTRAARELTERIKSAADEICVLLLEAHERRAWVALGYATWEQYVKSEFELSRRRSYELLIRARVTLELTAASGLPDLPRISTLAALQINASLPTVVRAIRRRSAGLPDRRTAEIVEDVVREARRGMRRGERRAASERSPRDERQAEPERSPRDDQRTSPTRDRLSEALQLLSTMPAPAVVLAAFGEADQACPDDAEVERALGWLSEFARRLREARWHRRQAAEDAQLVCGGPHIAS